MIRRSNGQTVEAELAARGFAAIGVQADLAVRADARTAVQRVLERFGRFDILINNAGGAFTPIERSSIVSSPEQDVQALMAANFYSTLHMLQESIPALTRPGASSVNMATGVHGAHRDGSYAIYSAAEAAVVDLTIKLAVELGTEGIRVNAIAPGVVLTGRVAATAAARGVGNQNPATGIPLGRYGTVDDIANVVEFFATDQSQYVTGEMLTVSGVRHRLTAE